MIFYYVRVTFVSLEFLCFLLAGLAFVLWGSKVDGYLSGISLNEDAVEWVFLYPIAIAAWVFNTGANVLFPSESGNVILHRWPGYWRLKAHFNVGVFYCAISALPCLFLWLTNDLVSSLGFFVCLACFSATSISAFSFFKANIKLREILISV